MSRNIKLAYLVTHPIQYQAPLLRRIAAEPGITLKAFFLSDFSVRNYTDPGFGRTVRWDVPLLEGYESEVLPRIGDDARQSWIRPLVYGLRRRLREGCFDVIWVHGWAHVANIVAIRSARKTGARVLLRGESGIHLAKHRGTRQFLKDAFLKWLFARVDGFLSIGSNNRAFYRAYGVSESKVFDVPYAVDNAFFQARCEEAAICREALRAELGLEQGRPIILFASKFIARKRADLLLEAYLRLSPDGRSEPHPYLLFVGDGPTKTAIESRAAATGWRSICFLGFRNQTELPGLYDLCDVFVLPSEQEPWGLVINEVMNARKAVIVSDQVGCAPDLVRNGVNGFVFSAGDVGALTVALEAGLNADCAFDMGKESARIIKQWGLDADCDGLKRALEAVL